VVYQTTFRWHIYSAIIVPQITGIGQLLLKLSLVVGWYPFILFFETVYIATRKNAPLYFGPNFA